MSKFQRFGLHLSFFRDTMVTSGCLRYNMCSHLFVITYDVIIGLKVKVTVKVKAKFITGLVYVIGQR